MKKQYFSVSCVLIDLEGADILTLSNVKDDSIQKPTSLDFDNLF